MGCSWAPAPVGGENAQFFPGAGLPCLWLPFSPPRTRSQVPCSGATQTLLLPTMPFLLGGKALVFWQAPQEGRRPREADPSVSFI